MSLRMHRKNSKKFLVNPTNPAIKCNNCEGTGKITNINYNVFGEEKTVGICYVCRGSGKIRFNRKISW